MSEAAIVTGGARGIGAATARVLALRGLKVAVLDILESEASAVADEIVRTGGQAFGIRCDVSKRAEVESAIAQIETRWATPLVVVNNAGVGGPFHQVDEVSDEEWDWIINTNLRSVFLFCRALLPKMKAAGYGRIVNISSIQGLLGATRSSTYAASKHGMMGYTRSIAAEWGAHGITCNAICPGYVDTQLGIQSDKVDRYLERVLAKSPIQRVARPEEIAAMVAHLIGPEGSYVNGAAISIDGGITAHAGIT